MRIIITKTEAYKFDELSEDAKQKVLEKMYDWQIDHDWWEFIYEDAENIGIKITGFDIDRDNYCCIENLEKWSRVAKNIIENHGKSCEIYKTARKWLRQLNLKTDEKREEAEERFSQELSEDYRIMLQKEFKYLVSEEAIKGTIEANEYEFTAEGELI